MTRPSTPERQGESNPAIKGVRIALWLLPGVIVPIMAIISIFMTGEWYAAVIPIVLLEAGFGWIDQRLCCQQLMLYPVRERLQMMRGTLAFAMFQLLITPALSIAVLFSCYVIFRILN